MNCKICGEEFSEPKKFHMHVARKHKTRIEVYYREHFPRFDLLTNEPIKFKNYEFYFSSLFNNRQNMVNWFKQQDSGEPVVRLMVRILTLRKKVKELTWAPSTVEARTSILPTPALIQHLRLDYNLICEKVGLKRRYEYGTVLEFEEETDFNIIVDTREQKPLDFNCTTIVSKLDFGDYTTQSNYKAVFIERKSLADLCGTLSAGYERVQREFQRCKDFDSSLVICVEENLNTFMDLQHTSIGKKMKATSEFLAHRVREVCQKYPHVQFLFLNNREEMAATIKKILLLKTPIHSVDLQYYYDSKVLSEKLV